MTIRISELPNISATDLTSVSTSYIPLVADTASLTTYKTSIANVKSYVTAGNLNVVGAINANLTSTLGNLIITGNLNVQGTTTTTSSQNLSTNSSIIDLHTFNSNLAPWTTDDGRDIGLRFFFYKNSTANAAALVWENSNSILTWYGSGVGNANTGLISGTLGTMNLGELLISNSTPSTSTATGALQVAGGAGVTGNINAGGSVIATGSASFNGLQLTGNLISTNSLSMLGSATVTSLQTNAFATIGSTLVVAGTTTVNNLAVNNNVTIGNSLSTGTLITAGNVTANALSVNNSVTVGSTLGVSGNITADGRIFVTQGESSTSSITGAVRVTGGIGASGNIYAGGIVNAANSLVSGNTLVVTGTATFNSAAYAPTAANGTVDTQVATTQFVSNAIISAVGNLGTLSTQNANSVTITGGTITGITDLAVADGGTGRSTLTANALLVGNGTSGLNSISPGAANYVIKSDGTNWSASQFVIPTGAGAVNAGGSFTVTTGATGKCLIQIFTYIQALYANYGSGTVSMVINSVTVSSQTALTMEYDGRNTGAYPALTYLYSGAAYANITVTYSYSGPGAAGTAQYSYIGT
jgi:hypothetical protein